MIKRSCEIAWKAEEDIRISNSVSRSPGFSAMNRVLCLSMFFLNSGMILGSCGIETCVASPN